MSEVVDLRNFGAIDLEPLLLDEIEEWKSELDWDFEVSASLVRKFADMRALGGSALMDGGHLAGYGYTVLEEHKGLIGDLYVRTPWRNTGAEQRLFRALLDDLVSNPRIRRVESQLMLVDADTAKLLQRERFVRLFERILMSCETSHPLPEGRANQLDRFHIEPWGERHLKAAAAMMVLAYDGHVDAQINDQYRSLEGAETFLGNILRYSGCGNFFGPGSFAAVDRMTGWLAGMVLCGFVSSDVAHITQVCVSPRARGTGLGYELLRRSAAAVREGGARRISLTVTSANNVAAQLYLGCGFTEVRRFYAYVWERY